MVVMLFTASCAAGHSSSSIVIERGPVSGPGCSMSPGSAYCKPTMTWTKEGLPPSPSSTAEKIKTTCGVPGTKYYGELLVFPGTEVSGHYAQVGDREHFLCHNPETPDFFFCKRCFVNFQ